MMDEGAPALVLAIDLAADLRERFGTGALEEACRRLGQAQVDGDHQSISLLMQAASLILESDCIEKGRGNVHRAWPTTS